MQHGSFTLVNLSTTSSLRNNRVKPKEGSRQSAPGGLGNPRMTPFLSLCHWWRHTCQLSNVNMSSLWPQILRLRSWSLAKNREQKIHGEHLGNLWFSLSPICAVLVNTVVTMDLFSEQMQIGFAIFQVEQLYMTACFLLLAHFCAYPPPALIFLFSNVKMYFFFFKPRPKCWKKCSILKSEPLMELQMTDGGETTRLGDGETWKNERKHRGKKTPAYLLLVFRICSFPDICFSMQQLCFQNSAYSSPLSKYQDEEKTQIMHPIIHQVEYSCLNQRFISTLWKGTEF